MKRITAMLSLLLFIQSSYALIVSVRGEGEVPAEGMNLVITEGEEDPLTGRYTMALKGELLTSSSQITIRITRSSAGLEDEFCCGSNCTAGNGETMEERVFSVSGVANWYAHFMPAPGADETISYVFDDGEQTCEIHAQYLYTTGGVEQGTAAKSNAKRMQNGQVEILHNGQVYSLTGTRID